MNDIGAIRLKTAKPLVFDGYTTNRLTGSFILIEQGTNATVAAGMFSAPTETVKPDYVDFTIRQNHGRDARVTAANSALRFKRKWHGRPRATARFPPFMDFLPPLALNWAMAEKSVNEISRDVRAIFQKGNDALIRENYDYAVDLLDAGFGEGTDFLRRP